MLTLDVAISTYRPEGIERVVKMLRPLEPKKGVRYVVSWQEHGDAPLPTYLADRGDVEVWRTDLKGLSNNRNNSIEHCRGDIVLIADDDLEYYPDFAEKIISAFEEKPLLDLGIFKVEFHNPKKYPEETCRLSLPFPKGYYCSSVEITFRRERLNVLSFSPEMGLGAPVLQSGEDELFLISAIKRGYDCEFFPIAIATHPSESTGDKISPGTLRAQGFIMAMIYPLTSFLRIPLKAYRVSKTTNAPFFKSTYQLLKGLATYHKTWKTIPKQYRW